MDSVIQHLNNRGQEATEDVLAGKINKMAVMENIIKEVFVRRFLMEENNSYRDLLVVIKNRYPNLRVCSLRTVKRVCTYHGIKKRMSVADGNSRYRSTRHNIEGETMFQIDH